MAFSGFCALSLEVIWTRLLVLLLGNSIYAFSAMLASFLMGIGVGSLISGHWMRYNKNLSEAFCVLQALLGVAIAGTIELYRWQGLSHLDASYLYSPIQSSGDFFTLFVMSMSIIVPVTIIYGMLFPLAVGIADARGSGDAVGRVYAFNTVGSVVGPLVCGFILIPTIGTRYALYLLCGIHIVLGALVAVWEEYRGARWLIGVGAALVIALAIFRPDPYFEIIQARLLHRSLGRVIFNEEGASSTVTLFAGARGETLILINGIVVSGKGDLGRLMVHLPLILQADPKRALIICLGAGNTFRAAVDHHVATDLVELEPEVVSAFSSLWADHDSYLNHSGVRIFINDGRNFLLTSRDRYDVIVVDGTPPIYSAGTVNLYSKEFVRLTQKHLTSTGVFALWVPLPCFERDFGMIARNFTDIFPHVVGWAQPGSKQWGILLMGSDKALNLDPQVLLRRAIARGLIKQNPWLNPYLLNSNNIISDASLRILASSYSTVTDNHPYTEFPLPLFLNNTPLRKTPDFALHRP